MLFGSLRVVHMTQKQLGPYTTGEVARICRVAPRTVSKWFDSKRLGGYVIPMSRNRRIPHTELLKFMRANHFPVPREWDDTVDLLIGHERAQAWQAGLTTFAALGVKAEILASPYALGIRVAQTNPSAVLVAYESSFMPFSLFAIPQEVSSRVRHLALVDGRCSLNDQAQLLNSGYHAVIVRTGPLEASVNKIVTAFRPTKVSR